MTEMEQLECFYHFYVDRSGEHDPQGESCVWNDQRREHVTC
jgi:hypothetical protein